MLTSVVDEWTISKFDVTYWLQFYEPSRKKIQAPEVVYSPSFPPVSLLLPRLFSLLYTLSSFRLSFRLLSHVSLSPCLARVTLWNSRYPDSL